MRRTYRFDKDLDCIVEVRADSNYFEERPQGPNVIKDDIGAGVNGLRHMASGRHFDSKSAFRQHTKDRGLEEVGGETNFASRPPTPDKHRYHKIVKESWDKFDGNYNGTADQTRRSEKISQWRRENGGGGRQDG